MSKELTHRQSEILNYIADYIEDNNRPPTISDIKDFFGFKSPQSVVDHLKALEKKGKIERLPRSRGIVLLDSKNKFPILGEVAAGNPLASEECFDGVFNLEEFYEAENTFVLRVKGDSMIESGIYNGDLVFIKPVSNVENGEIVVAYINNEYTVKRFIREKNTVILKPENPNYKPIEVTEEDEFMIIGRVVGIHRILK